MGKISEEVVTEKTVGPICAIDTEIQPNIKLILLFPGDAPVKTKSLELILESFRKTLLKSQLITNNY